MIDYVYKFRLYPNKEQQDFLDKQIGCVRFVYNEILSRAKKEYEKNGKRWNIYEYKKFLPSLKEEYPFLKEANSQSLQQAIFNLDTAFKKFFTQQAGFPNFKKKKNSGSIHIPQFFKIEGNLLWVPKLKTPIRIKLYRKIEGRIKSLTIEKTSSSEYYASILAEKEIKGLPKVDSVISIDVGIKSFATVATAPLSNPNNRTHEHIENPKYLVKKEKKLKRLQKQLSKKQHKRNKTDTTRASNNYKKYAFKVAKLHEHITNERKDLLHKLSRRIIDENQVVILEDLNVKGMVKNHHLAKSISDASWSKFVDFLTYKANWYGRHTVRVDRFFPSSQECHDCGYRNTELTLKDRVWTCPVCGTHHDRDENASDVLMNEGLRILGQELPEFTPVEKSSVDDRREIYLKSTSSLKQEIPIPEVSKNKWHSKEATHFSEG